MDACELYKCIADLQRLRILNLLDAGPLCVCHLQELLEENQVKTSKQLAILKNSGLVQSERKGTWMVYSLQLPAKTVLRVNLDHLRKGNSPECKQLQADLEARSTLLNTLETTPEECLRLISSSPACC